VSNQPLSPPKSEEDYIVSLKGILNTRRMEEEGGRGGLQDKEN